MNTASLSLLMFFSLSSVAHASPLPATNQVGFPLPKNQCTDTDTEDVLLSLTTESAPKAQSPLCGNIAAQDVPNAAAVLSEARPAEDTASQTKPPQQTSVTENEHKTEQKSPPVIHIKPHRPAPSSAPMPYIYKKDDAGRRVCGTKKDKPHKSTKSKGRHMDMECCLDPDEYPNPNCYYSPSKYGKYLP